MLTGRQLSSNSCHFIRVVAPHMVANSERGIDGKIKIYKRGNSSLLVLLSHVFRLRFGGISSMRILVSAILPFQQFVQLELQGLNVLILCPLRFGFKFCGEAKKIPDADAGYLGC